jgi:glycosyltransferase involved in cell wall biosynthesis
VAFVTARENRTKKRLIGIVMPLAQQQGGAETLLMYLLRSKSKTDTYVCAFLEDGPLVAEVRALGISASVFPATRISDPVNYPLTMLRLARWMRQKRLAAVLSWMPKAHLYAGPAALLAGVKALWFQHSIPDASRINRIITGIPSKGILCCSGAAKAAQDAISPRRPSEICYPGVHLPPSGSIEASFARKQLDLPLDAPIIGMIARLERWKGGHVFLEAARILCTMRTSVQFFIVGGPHPRDPGYAEELQVLAAQPSLRSCFRFVGQIPASEVFLWQAAADVIVHPVTGEEPFGMAIVEAMGMGKVVVASDAGGPREIIRSGVDGFLVPRGDPNALAIVTGRLLDFPEERKFVEHQALQRAHHFSIEAFVKRVQELVEIFLQTS